MSRLRARQWPSSISLIVRHLNFLISELTFGFPKLHSRIPELGQIVPKAQKKLQCTEQPRSAFRIHQATFERAPRIGFHTKNSNIRGAYCLPYYACITQMSYEKT
jgi:hypothetical protein